MNPDDQTKADKEDYLFTGHWREEDGEEIYRPPWRGIVPTCELTSESSVEEIPLDCVRCGLYPRAEGNFCTRCYSDGVERALAIRRLAEVLIQIKTIPHATVHYHKAA